MRIVLIATALCLSLGACATPEGPGTVEPRRAEVGELESRHAVLFTSGSASVQEAEREALNRFLAPLLNDPHASVLVEAPAANADTLARDRSMAVVQMLAERQITTRLEPLNEYTPGSVRVLVRRVTAYVPNCPDWSSEDGSPFTNSVSSNFGCATARNLSLMIEDPNDLVRGRSSNVGTGNSAGDAVNRLRARQTVPLQAGGEDSGS